MDNINIKTDRMRYQTNALSFWLCLAALAFNITSMINIYKQNFICDYFIGIDVILNIVFMLFAFLGAEKSKTYKIDWAYKLGLMALLQVGRIFIVPLIFFLDNQLSGGDFAFNIVFLALSAAALAGAAVICYIKSDALAKHLENIKRGGE